ncbi:hypothetical protein R3P38DRAFT_3215061 [Favolaschia claudopus]|uniref:Uncharacterized protein n=1 Tax=Favolaschia claudopus TaxID=2862362 RepID=A0AAW0A8I2_9AGAR
MLFVDSSNLIDSDSESELSSEAGVSPVPTAPVQPPVPPPVPHNPGLPPAAANVPELVHVNFFDMNRPQDQPSEVPVLRSNVRISTEVNTGNGQVEYVASLAQLLPTAFQNACPIKERGGRIYCPNFRGAAAPLHIGKVEAIVEGTAKPLQLQVVDSYTLRHTNGDLFCDVFVDNTERVAAGNSTEDAALGGALSNDGPAEVPHPIEQPPEFTGAGSDIPLQIARARAANNTVSREVLVMYLTSVLKAAVPGLRDNWPRATTAGIVLERYMVEEQVVEFLRPWSRSSGGYVFPAGHGRFSDVHFIREDFLAAMNLKSSSSSNDGQLFAPENLVHWPEAKTWYDSKGQINKDLFDRMRTAEFKRQLKDRRENPIRDRHSGSRTRRRSPPSSPEAASLRKYQRSASVSSDEAREHRHHRKASSKKRRGRSITSENMDDQVAFHSGYTY